MYQDVLMGLKRFWSGVTDWQSSNSRNIQLAFADGETEEDRLEGLCVKYEDWHAIRNLFEVGIVIINYMHPDPQFLFTKST